MKLYADEEGHVTVRTLTAIAVSAIARVEVPAALWRKHRLGELAPEDVGVLVHAFEVDFDGAEGGDPRFAAVALTTTVLDDAARLCALHPLRAYDAVQLASALAARTADPHCDSFACSDDALRQAAVQRGFTLVP